MKVRSIIFICLISILCPTVTWGAVNAGVIIKKCAEKIRSSKSLIVDYTLTSGSQTMTGSLTMAGDCFHLSTPQVKSWYDGKTQWTYSTQIGEVNVTEPTSDELAQINPFAILESFSSYYVASTSKSSGGETSVSLTPKGKKSDIAKVLVTINDHSLYPSAIQLTLRGGQTFDIKVKSVTPGGLLSASKFKFNRAEYPGIQVVDLR